MSKETLSPASLARPMMLDILAASLIMEDNICNGSVVIMNYAV